MQDTATDSTATDAALPETNTGAYWLALFALMPKERRPRALELMLLIAGEAGKKELEAESRGYRDGRAESTDEARREGYDQGWSACVAEMTSGRIAADRAFETAATAATVPSC